MNKLIVLGILFLFVCSSVIPIYGFNLEQTSTISFDGNTLYVGGTGEGNYTKIQDAIDNASDGDTVFVYNGIYYGNEIYQDYDSIVLVNKSINLVGENKTTTIIDGGENDEFFNYIVLFIYADGSTFSGFTIRNGGSYAYGIAVYSSYVNISNNNIYTNCSKSCLDVGGSNNDNRRHNIR